MSLYLKIILILFGLAYLISPVDIIPELFLPFVGWIDDGFVLYAIFHLIRYGELPWFFFKKNARTTLKKEINPKNGSKANRSAHEILGISPDATGQEIQAAYKEKIKQYHPDKVSHLGEEFSHLANEKFLEIQRAYQDLKRNV